MRSLILDSGALSALAVRRGLLEELRRRRLWPAQVPSVVLAEALTGDHRRDFHVNRLLRTCQIRPVAEPLARQAAHLRTATGRAGSISAVDAVVVALADWHGGGSILTSDPGDIGALAENAAARITVVEV